MSDFINRPQIEVLSTADGVRRRQWSDEDKLRIVEESLFGHRQVTSTARRHGHLPIAVDDLASAVSER